ncbi:unnamed protein product, partial [Phaeothamnion confervicola]
WGERLSRLDRRWIYLLVALSVMVPLIFPLRLPIKTTQPTRGVYEAINALPGGSVMLFSFDYGPGTKVELHPMAVAAMHLAFRHDVKIVAIALDPAGQAMANEAFHEVAPIYKKEEGKDYVNLGYKAGNEAVLVSRGLNFRSTFPYDPQNKSQNPLMARVSKLDDFALVGSWSAGSPGALEHIRLTQGAYGRPLVVGVTAVQTPEFFPYYRAGQIKGLLGGLRGAAELEVLAGVPGTATPGMDAQSSTHFMLAFLIILSNVAYWTQRRNAN